MAKVGKKIKNFSRPVTGRRDISLDDLNGQYVVLYFYPKDNTPGCTVEGNEFKELHSRFRRQKALVLGVSRDSVQSHENFKAKFGFPFDLLSDQDEKLCKQFDVIREKNMYGRKVMGVERSTFLIDPDGVLVREWRKVKAKGHAAEVLDTIKEVRKS